MRTVTLSDGKTMEVGPMTGKQVRAYRGKRANPGKAQRADTKKAYVTLSEGAIQLFKEESQSSDGTKEKK